MSDILSCNVNSNTQLILTRNTVAEDSKLYYLTRSFWTFMNHFFLRSCIFRYVNIYQTIWVNDTFENESGFCYTPKLLTTLRSKSYFEVSINKVSNILVIIKFSRQTSRYPRDKLVGNHWESLKLKYADTSLYGRDTFLNSLSQNKMLL